MSKLLTLIFSSMLLVPQAIAGQEPPEIEESPPKQYFDLQPYTATYSSNFNGIDAEMERTLRKTSNNDWLLKNYASMLFVEVEEKAQFTTDEGKLTPRHYWFKNTLSSKRDSDLLFNASVTSAMDSRQTSKTIQLRPNSFDKLSFQSQLRLELLNNNGKLISNELHLVDKEKLKTYQFIMLDKEQIKTPAGSFNTIKLKQIRPGKDEYTLIWLAADWDYFVLRIERVKKDNVEFQVNLTEAKIAGEKIRGL